MKLKKWVKVSGLIIGGIIVISIIGNAVSGGNTNTVRTAEPGVTQPAKQKVEKISQENFDKIKTGDVLTGDGGMSIDDVKAILGEPDNDVASTTTINGKEYKSDSMTWAAGLQMKSITVGFINGHANTKGMMK